MGSSEPKLSQAQPCVVTSAPEANELTAMVPKTPVSMAPWARFFSSGW
jgi:hypothetical protein